MTSIQYKKIIPEKLKNIYSLDENCYLRDSLTKDQYDKICKLPKNQLKKWYKQINYIFDTNFKDIFNIFKINFKGEYEEITSCNNISNDNLPFHITILDDSLLCNFISQESLLNKIFLEENRYISYLIDLVTETKKAGHACLFVIDKYKCETFVIDSNGSLDYFNDIFEEYELNYFLHMAFEKYSNSIGFKYINLLENNINLKINVKINSKKQADFFLGYCKGWSLFFQYLLNKSEPNFEIIDYLKILSSYKNLGPINELVEIFQVWFYNNLFYD